MAQRLIAVVILVGILGLICGCTTTESDLPWNTPASWEGSPYVPGLSQ